MGEEAEPCLLWTSSESEAEGEEDEEVTAFNTPPLMWNAASNAAGVTTRGNKKKLLTRQLSMKETSREAKWEKRRKQILERPHVIVEGRGGKEAPPAASVNKEVPDGGGGYERRFPGSARSLTDEDLDELRGCIELGFGFNEEEGGHDLHDTVPALELYFAVNRQLSEPKSRSSLSPSSTPTAASSPSAFCSWPSPWSPVEHPHASPSESWKICSPGDNPQHVKTRLRHWAQAVACSVRQCAI